VSLRLLFVADSHLGIDTPVQARVARRRRGDDFLTNHRTALATALDGSIDLVVHGGDVFDRPRVPATLAYQAYEPLIRIADRGIPVFIVPGNHERSRLPHIRFARHPNIHIFESPSTFVTTIRGLRIALTGFPYERRDVRTQFPLLLEQSRWCEHDADVRLLCVHHCVEGATVGPNDFVFRTARDVIRHCDVPPNFHALLSGHIHRQQVLTKDLRGRPLHTPVVYPGSVERTAFAEVGERKGYLTADIGMDGVSNWTVHELPARPMLRQRIDAQSLNADQLTAAVKAVVDAAPLDAVLTIHVAGELNAETRRGIRAEVLRRITPATMNVDIRLDDVARVFARPRSMHQPTAIPASPNAQLSLM
jgi:exonuclease SbcD